MKTRLILTAALAILAAGCWSGCNLLKATVAAITPARVQAVTTAGVKLLLTSQPNLRPQFVQADTDLGLALAAPGGLTAAQFNAILAQLPKVTLTSPTETLVVDLVEGVFNDVVSGELVKLQSTTTGATVTAYATAFKAGLDAALAP